MDISHSSIRYAIGRKSTNPNKRVEVLGINTHFLDDLKYDEPTLLSALKMILEESMMVFNTQIQIVHAIKSNQTVSFTCQKFWTDAISARKAAPYALKEFKDRWYVLAKDEKDNRIKTFGLDRITDLQNSRKKFIYPKNFSVGELYENSFGIINPTESKADEIVLFFDAEQGKYLKSFPLHSSQTSLIDNKKELQIHLKLHITHDFIMEILSYGERVMVVSPDSLKKELKAHYQKALSYYN